MLGTEIANWLQYQGIGTFDESGGRGDIFVDALPAVPENVVAIYHTGGLRGDGTPNDYVTIQIIVRGGQDPRPAVTRAQSILDALQYFNGGYFCAGGHYVVLVIPMQAGPTHIGQDENRRHEYSMNFEMMVLNEARARA